MRRRRDLMIFVVLLFGLGILLGLFWYREPISRFMGLKPYPNTLTQPRWSRDRIQVVAILSEPPNKIAVNQTGRIFVTLHPLAKNKNAKLLEITQNGQGSAYPNDDWQGKFNAPSGVFVDSQERLWVLDGARHAIWSPQKLYVFDLKNNQNIGEYDFPASVAEPGSYLTDLVVAPNGKHVYIANSSRLLGKPSLIIFDTENFLFRRTLVETAALKAEDYGVQVRHQTVRRWKIKAWKSHFNGIAIHPSGQFLALAAMNNAMLYGLKIKYLGKNNDDKSVENHLVQWHQKPANESLVFDPKGRLYLTDVEHATIMRLSSARAPLESLVQDYEYLRWANGLAVGADRYLYVTSTGLHGLIGHMNFNDRSNSPYYVVRIPLD